MQDARRISVDLDALLKVSSTGVSVGTKPSEPMAEADADPQSGRRIAVDVDALLKVNSTGVAVGTKPGIPPSAGEISR